MKKDSIYSYCYFSADILQTAVGVFEKILTDQKMKAVDRELSVIRGIESWTYDSREEFYSDYRKDPSYAHLRIVYEKDVSYWFSITYEAKHRGLNIYTSISVQAPTRPEIEAVFDVFEKHSNESKVPEPDPPPKPKPTIFIGHGRSTQWRDLKDHLHDQHGYEIEAYEVGARAGHEIRDILDDMADRSTFAVLVMTGEDADAQGKLRARQNVVHELGLFQGRLGFSRAIVLLEEGTEEFSNIQGIHQIRYGKGNIRETYGDVLATIRREFGH